MIIHTKLCYKSDNEMQFDRLGIEPKNKEKYKTSDFSFNLEEVTGIDAPMNNSEYFVIFLPGSNGLLIQHNYKELLIQWQNLKR